MSDYLYANPSFLSGTARTFDMFGVFDEYNQSETPEQADLIAATSDWHAVGTGIRESMGSLKLEPQDARE